MQPEYQPEVNPSVNPSPLAPPAMFSNGVSQPELEAVRQPYGKSSILFLILLLLTFFTPLGAALFLPLLIVGGIAALRSTKRSQKDSVAATGHRNPLISLVRFILITGGVIVLLIVGLIALLFVGLATGLIDFRMGS